MRGMRKTTCALIAVLLLLTGTLVLAGCGSDNSTKEGREALSGANPFVAAAKQVKQIAGTETTSGDITQTRDMKVTYEIEASDPRAGGTFEVSVNMDSAADDSTSMWGTFVLTNGKGTWVCDKWSGAIDRSLRRYTFSKAVGTGDYESLVLYVNWSFMGDYTTMLPPAQGFAVSGWIQKE